MRVKATKRIFFQMQLRRVGAVFDVDDAQFNPRTMARVPAETPERSVSAQQAIDEVSIDRYGLVIRTSRRPDDE